MGALAKKRDMPDGNVRSWIFSFDVFSARAGIVQQVVVVTPNGVDYPMAEAFSWAVHELRNLRGRRRREYIIGYTVRRSSALLNERAAVPQPTCAFDEYAARVHARSVQSLSDVIFSGKEILP